MAEKQERRFWTGGLVILLAALAIAAPFVLGKLAHAVLGALMLGAGLLELYNGFGMRDRRRGNSAFLGSATSIIVGLLLLALPNLAVSAQALLLGLSFIVSGLSRMVTAARSRDNAGWRVIASDALLSVLLGVCIAVQWPVKGIVSIGLLVGLRMLSAGWAMMFGRGDAPVLSEAEAARLHPDARMGLPPHDELATFRQAWQRTTDARGPFARHWRRVFIVIFFAIHVGRMDVDWNLVGFLSPGVAVAGDLAMAMLLSWCLIMPARLLWRGLTRPFERRAWKRLLGASPDAGSGPAVEAGFVGRLVNRLLRPWLKSRYAFSARVQQARRSPTMAAAWGLELGLPLTAILIALHPIWGMTWYFNTENWATGAWEKWTEYRVDDWRMAMVNEVRASHAGIAEGDLFRVTPPGVSSGADFSFIVIGDTGEGDNSQNVLRDQFILLGQRPDVKFLVLSSDVIYPSGAMKDYESKFYLPFKGFTKPIYAVPGNHDWYDALDAFAANFLEPDAARAALRGRRAADRGLTSTTETKVEQMLTEAARLRDAYDVKTGLQRAPFFELQTDRFALLVVDTGILKTIDKEQEAWLKNALERSRGKFKMAILGHPLYAAGYDQGVDDPPFAELHDLLRTHQFDVVMAGDTHSLEYYREALAAQDAGAARTMHHFVNGGGGAYLSIGSQLDWPKQHPVPDCAFYPRTEAIVSKLDHETPAWKWPLWFWLKRFAAWPSTVETLASAFDFNHAPFFQSFVEIRVEFSSQRVRFIPHGARGPLRWRDFQAYGQVMPAERQPDDVVEFIVPMSNAVP